ncbi:hypothetical protein [Thermus sp.]|uniref:hypothetical protein n=1 Tax=Thermus sp. TaxID=275 RepID=UPI00298ED786|nr:hypothetical protein [Thermus sp.]MDW8358611.1 hypothetical protein [Thermus sp.]
MDSQAQEPKQSLQHLLEQALGRKLPQVGTHEFNQVLVELSRKDPGVMATLAQVLHSVGTPSKPRPDPLPKGAPPAGPGRGEEGFGGEPAMPQKPAQDQAKPQAPQPEARPEPEGEAQGDKPPQEERGKGAGAKTDPYKAFRRKAESKQQAERGLQRLLKVLEPNLRTFVLHPRKVLLVITLVLSPIAIFWLFEQSIRDFLSGRNSRGSQVQAVQPPPPPPPQTAQPPQEGGVAPPAPSPEGPQGGSEAPQGETGTPPGENGAPGAQNPSSPQGTQAPSDGASAPPSPPSPSSPGGSTPPPPNLPVYGENLPPPPPAGGEGGCPWLSTPPTSRPWTWFP